MSDDRLPTKLLVGAQIRQAAVQGVPITVLRSGDPQSGAIVLKINRLDGTAHVLLQMRQDEELVWSPADKQDPLPEAQADALVTRQGHYDPDVWLIEIEDRTGNHWFPGRRLA